MLSVIDGYSLGFSVYFPFDDYNHTENDKNRRKLVIAILIFADSCNCKFLKDLFLMKI